MFSINEFDRRHATYGDAFYARVATGTHTLHLSRYDTETEWVVDGVWVTANSYPVYHNGLGSRCTALRVVTEADLVAALNARAADWGEAA